MVKVSTMTRSIDTLLLVLLTSVCAAATPPATWTTGHKKVLIIPVRFTDYSGPSDVPNYTGTTSGWGSIANGTMTAQMSAFMARQSYGKCTLEFTVLPEIDMGVSYTAYNAPLNSDSSLSKFTRFGEPGSFLDDARAVGEPVFLHAHRVHHGEEQVGHARVRVHGDVFGAAVVFLIRACGLFASGRGGFAEVEMLAVAQAELRACELNRWLTARPSARRAPTVGQLTIEHRSAACVGQRQVKKACGKIQKEKDVRCCIKHKRQVLT